MPLATTDVDYLGTLGPLALASRARRLAEKLAAEVARVYRDEGVPFEPRWFGVFHLLAAKAPLSIREAAAELGVSHTAVSQVVRELERAHLVSVERNEHDARCRALRLSSQGRARLSELRPLWADFEAGSRSLLDEIDAGQYLEVVSEIENALDRDPLSERVRRRVSRRHE